MGRDITTTLVAALLLLAAVTAPRPARAAAEIDEAWRWTTFTTESGLPADRAGLIAIGPDGPWVLTQKGVARFDGWEWQRVMLPGFEPGAAARSLAVMPGGDMLVVAGSRLFLGNAKGMARVRLDPEIDRWYIGAAAPYRDGILVVLHRDTLSVPSRIVFVDRAGHVQSEDALADLPPDAHFLTQAGGTVFVAFRGGIAASAGGPWETVIPCPGESPAHREVSGPPGGPFLVGIRAPASIRGLWSYTPGRPAERVAGEPEQDIVTLAVAPDGDAIVSRVSGALRWRHDGEWRELEGSWPMLREAACVAYGDDGALWSSTQHGVHRARAGPARWTRFPLPADGSGSSVHGMLRSRDGSLWLTTSDGVTRHHPDGAVEHVSMAAGIELVDATGLAEDRDGNIWVSGGGSFSGAVRFDGTAWTHVPVGDVSPARPGRIHRIVTDPSGRPRFLALAPIADDGAQDGGVLVEEGGRLVPSPLSRLLPSQRVYAVAFAPDGTEWYATYAGLTRIREGQCTNWDLAQGLKARRAFDVAVTPAGQPWFTDQLNGVGTIRPDGSVEYLGSAAGLPSDEAWAVVVDHRRRVWVTTTAGIACVDGDTTWAIGTESGLPLARTWPILVERDQVLVGTLGRGAARLSLDEPGDPPPRVQIAVVGATASAATVTWRSLGWQGAPSPGSIETRHRLDGGTWSKWSRENRLVVPLRSSARVLDVEAKSIFPGNPSGSATQRVEFTVPWHQRPWFLGLEALAAVAALVVLGVVLVRRRRQAAELRHGEARFRLLSSVVTEGVAVVEGRGRILDANPALGELLGRDPGGLVGADLAAILGASIPDPGAPPVEMLVRRPGGDERVAEVIARVHAWRGHGATVVVLRDVTERKQAETQRLELELRLRRAHELESLGLLAGRIAHDFNNVLAAVIGNQDLAAERIDDPVVSSHLERSRAAARQAADLSQQMLSASGRGRLVVRDVDLSVHVDQMIDFLKASLPKSTRIVRDLASELPAIEADPTQLSQLILNLVTNASDAIGGRGGTITLRTALTADATGVLLEVEDDGTGIDAAARARLFEPFFTTRPDGRGLGLVTVSAVAKTHGAAIDVESEPGHGARFRVTFPATTRRAASKAPAPPPPAAALDAPLGLVLVADDEPMVRALTAGLLKRLGATILEAVDGAEALQLVDARGSELDAAVIDLTMPRASGLEVLEAIRRARPALPVVLVTGYSMDDVASRVAGDPHVGVLAKPFSAPELRDLLATLRSRRDAPRDG